ncbi:hypothetical protein BDR07DRAFT_1607643 [Suillus spraguei]|nr:hypothetical protein BDR07DRAFT_1608881 [Suillus spraguei]KAG2365196.1 hypothetical protein BDR07DRAFT_1607643 [Suillus spraguei]
MVRTRVGLWKINTATSLRSSAVSVFVLTPCRSLSIQSMIPCEEPYLNEPGWANDGGASQSRQYSSNVRRMVVKTAMLGNLKNPPEPFGDILDKWLILDDSKATIGDSFSTRQDSSGSSNGFKKDVEEMQQSLRQMQDDTFKVDK